jgi:hypothetical protein
MRLLVTSASALSTTLLADASDAHADDSMAAIGVGGNEFLEVVHRPAASEFGRIHVAAGCPSCYEVVVA